MSKGWSIPPGGWLEVLFWEQVEQANTNCLWRGHQGTAHLAQTTNPQDTPFHFTLPASPFHSLLNPPGKGPLHPSGKDGLCQSPKFQNRRECISGLTFFDPGWYERVKLNRQKKSTQRTWHELNFLPEWMYSCSWGPSRRERTCADTYNQRRHSPKANMTANSSLLPIS